MDRRLRPKIARELDHGVLEMLVELICKFLVNVPLNLSPERPYVIINKGNILKILGLQSNLRDLIFIERPVFIVFFFVLLRLERLRSPIDLIVIIKSKTVLVATK